MREFERTIELFRRTLHLYSIQEPAILIMAIPQSKHSWFRHLPPLHPCKSLKGADSHVPRLTAARTQRHQATSRPRTPRRTRPPCRQQVLHTLGRPRGRKSLPPDPARLLKNLFKLTSRPGDFMSVSSYLNQCREQRHQPDPGGILYRLRPGRLTFASYPAGHPTRSNTESVTASICSPEGRPASRAVAFGEKSPSPNKVIGRE